MRHVDQLLFMKMYERYVWIGLARAIAKITTIGVNFRFMVDRLCDGNR